VGVIQKHSFLVCPLCKQQLQIEVEKSELYCFECSVAFPTQILYGWYEFTSFAKIEADWSKKNKLMYDANNLNERYQGD
jgi:hypothetical protein